MTWKRIGGIYAILSLVTEEQPNHETTGLRISSVCWQRLSWDFPETTRPMEELEWGSIVTIGSQGFLTGMGSPNSLRTFHDWQQLRLPSLKLDMGLRRLDKSQSMWALFLIIKEAQSFKSIWPRPRVQGISIWNGCPPALLHLKSVSLLMLPFLLTLFSPINPCVGELDSSIWIWPSKLLFPKTSHSKQDHENYIPDTPPPSFTCSTVLATFSLYELPV